MFLHRTLKSEYNGREDFTFQEDHAMRLSVKSLTITSALLWGGVAMFLTGIVNLVAPPYGEHFLLTMSSVYPGYHATRTLGDVLVGTGYGLVDGGIAGLVFALLYNFFAGEVAKSS